MTSLQEIKAMLDKYDKNYLTGRGRSHGVHEIVAFARAAIPVVQAAIEQEREWARLARTNQLDIGTFWTEGLNAYMGKTSAVESATITFTESYPDERA